jgi:carbamoyltransferase
MNKIDQHRQRSSAVGINKSHCASISLVDEIGQPIFSASEERFTRVKLQRGMPHKAFEYAAAHYDMSDASIAMGRLDTRRRIVREWEYYRNCMANNLFAIPAGERLAEVARLWYSKKIKRDRTNHRLAITTKYFMGRDPDHGYEHHLCHMASAYYPSGFSEAFVVSVDGVGDLLTAVIGRGKGKSLTITDRYFQSEHISGQAYEIVTGMLGFDPDRHPGKVTGLAAYAGTDPSLVAEMDKWFRAQYRTGSRENWFYLIHNDRAEENLERLRQVRYTRFGAWSREEICSAIQFMLERDVLELIRRHCPDPTKENIVLAGGVFANVKLNQRVKELGFKQIFIQPAMGDEGTGYGAAILAAHERNPFAPYRLKDTYLGPEFSPAEIRRALASSGLDFCELTDGAMEYKMAELLHQGYIIARFQGRMEFGPRALGNRSILYHTKDPKANDWLNTQLKRSEFMPFAPMTLREHADECYHGMEGAEHAAEFMTITFNATERMKSQSPACCHVDGTARPQIVGPDTNRSIYDTLRHYHAISGIPSVINTSFNMHEEPIICTPEEAVRAYGLANLDALAIGDFLVTNESEAAIARRQSAYKVTV